MTQHSPRRRAATRHVPPLFPRHTTAEVARHLELSDTEVLVVEAILEPVANAALDLLAKEDKRWLAMPVFTNGASQHGRPNLRDIIADPNVPFANVIEVCIGSIYF